MIIKVIGVPVHAGFPKEGVTVIVPEIGALVPFVVVNAGILPDPLAAKPIAVFEFVQV